MAMDLPFQTVAQTLTSRFQVVIGRMLIQKV